MGNYKVGVNVIEGKSISPIAGMATNVSAIIGNFEKGAVNTPTLVGSMADFISKFGDKPATGTTGWLSVKGFYESMGNGFAPLYIVRIASDSATASSKMLVDQNGTPANTLKVEASSPGTWGDNLQIAVNQDNYLTTSPAVNIDASAESATLKSVSNLQIGSYIQFDNGSQQEIVQLTGVNSATKEIAWSGGLTYAYTTANGTITSLEFEIVVYKNGFEVERWPNLSIVDTVDHYCETIINGNSNYITVTDQKVSDVDENDIPATLIKTSLTGGDDGLDDVEGSDYEGVQASKTGIYALDGIPNLTRFCIPNPELTDVDADAAYQSLVQAGIDYAESRSTVMFYFDVPAGKTPTEAVTFRNNFESKNAALFYPWLTVNAFNAETDVPPSSFALGAAVKKDYVRGIHKNIGNTKLAWAIGLEYDLSVAEAETTNDANICNIRAFAGSGIRVYGGRTLSNETAWRFIHYKEIWNYIASSIMASTQPFVFETNDLGTWQAVKRVLTVFLTNETRKGVLADPSNPGNLPFTVVCDETVNPSGDVALGIMHAVVEYVPVSTAEKFVVTLTSSPLGLAVSA